jgi:hypothetical protein
MAFSSYLLLLLSAVLQVPAAEVSGAAATLLARLAPL